MDMELKELAAKLKQEVEGQRSRGTRWRFDEDFRARVVAYWRARQTEGGTQEDAARELELSSWPLSRWGRRGGPVRRGRPTRVSPETSTAAFHAVAVLVDARGCTG
ncbi:hypothetical protein HRD49_13975 [Corallococcus exiguus]|uniref:hypothetical protein n=1 Tax=Corallococcus TaxID=83461 RepID=UPI000EB8AD34|nr:MULTISPECIES: hypothetical protein [Corallococcus]NRD62855.1 hypothetical protein [Corallococcus exiguus]RKI20500.1 hypothetical protein D7Y15_00110 [Corallococcus sp. AB030]